MKRIIRQVFGTTRPKEIWGDLLTFDRLLTKPIVHIIYWAGLGLLFIAACVVLGTAVGTVWKDHSVSGVLLGFPVLIFGWLGVLIATLLWRGACELVLAVLSIAEDLRILRQYQEKLEIPPQAAPAAKPASEPIPEPQYQPAAEPAPPPEANNILEDPFFNPRFGKRDY